jgi:hypothetical protein
LGGALLHDRTSWIAVGSGKHAFCGAISAATASRAILGDAISPIELGGLRTCADFFFGAAGFLTAPFCLPLDVFETLFGADRCFLTEPRFALLLFFVSVIDLFLKGKRIE